MKNNVFEKIMDIYKKSWEEQDSDLILTIFSNNGIYHDKPHNIPLKGHNEIKKYLKKSFCGKSTQNLEIGILG